MKTDKIETRKLVIIIRNSKAIKLLKYIHFINQFDKLGGENSYIKINNRILKLLY